MYRRRYIPRRLVKGELPFIFNNRISLVTGSLFNNIVLYCARMSQRKCRVWSDQITLLFNY